MTILRTGASRQYSENWSKAFGESKGKAAGGKKAAGKRQAAKRAAPRRKAGKK